LRLTQRGGFGNTTVALPDGQWTNVLTGATLRGGSVPVEHVLGGLRVAVLGADGDGGD
jgi:(1->4)-alpha-D-glucan 1-alpha-D-glucosylmutase